MTYKWSNDICALKIDDGIFPENELFSKWLLIWWRQHNCQYFASKEKIPHDIEIVLWKRSLSYKCCALVRLSNPVPEVLDSGRDPFNWLLDTSSQIRDLTRPIVGGKFPINEFWVNPLNTKKR